jgi:ABC-type transporter Mla maintaining outer membrane lipid asymmetry ATPase subunit MlaF
MDPEVLFFDEPSSGLDPITASRLDDLILQLRNSFGTTIVVVSHDLASIFRIADRALFLDIGEKTMTALGAPAELRDNPPNAEVHRFLTRSSGGEGAEQTGATPGAVAATPETSPGAPHIPTATPGAPAAEVPRPSASPGRSSP